MTFVFSDDDNDETQKQSMIKIGNAMNQSALTIVNVIYQLEFLHTKRGFQHQNKINCCNFFGFTLYGDGSIYLFDNK